jgi:hypothetical protein
VSKATKKNPPGRHHFLPRFFIKRFSENTDETVYVYDKTHDHLGTFPQPAAKICHGPHIYSLGVAGTRHPLLEDAFSAYETKWADAFRMLDQSLPEVNAVLSDRNAENIIRFFYACQFWRSPKRHKLAIDTADRLMELYDAMDKPAHLLAPIERKELKRIIKLKASVDSAKIIQNFLFPLMTYMTPAASGAMFHVIEKPRDYEMDLLCADVGVVGESIEDVFSGDEVKFFPLSSERLLVLSRDADAATTDAVDRFQIAMVASASQHVFCATQMGLAKHVHRIRGSQ